MEKDLKKTLDENKKFVMAACLIGTVIVVGIGGVYLYKHTYKHAFFKGEVAGFQGGIDWFDRTFEGFGLREKFEVWEKLNPEQMKYKA